MEDWRNLPSMPIAEQASRWWTLMHDEDASPSVRRGFADWVSRSPERMEAWLQMAALMHALKSGTVRWPEVSAEALIREAKAAAPEVLPIFQRRHERAGTPDRKRMPLFFALAASLIAAVLIVTAVLDRSQDMATAIGEQRSVVLADGSLVMLNTDSKIAVDFRKDRRIIRLVRGEALFNVVHDVNRPFDVLAGKVILRALGTQFNVRYQAQNAVLTVVEGRVAVIPPQPLPAEQRPPVLAAMESLVITNAVPGTPHRVSNIAAATEWTQRRLVFEDRTIDEVAAEFSRYNRQAIHIDDPELRNQRITGVFQATDLKSFATFLSGIPGVRIETTEDGVHVLAAGRH